MAKETSTLLVVFDEILYLEIRMFTFMIKFVKRKNIDIKFQIYISISSFLPIYRMIDIHIALAN